PPKTRSGPLGLLSTLPTATVVGGAPRPVAKVCEGVVDGKFVPLFKNTDTVLSDTRLSPWLVTIRSALPLKKPTATSFGRVPAVRVCARTKELEFTEGLLFRSTDTVPCPTTKSSSP